MSILFLHLLLLPLHLILIITRLFPFLRRLLITATAPPPTTATATSSPPLPPPPNLQPKYDVFISFRGDDVRDTFLSHLYNHLSHHKKISTYMDDVDLARGESISPSLSTAIERSTVYIVIFSPNYAESKWCLEELVMILECGERYRRKVIPVFYGGVSPSDVGSQVGSYRGKLPREATTTERVRVWRDALTKAGNISGFDSRVIRPETRLTEEISRAVLEGMHTRITTMTSNFDNAGLIGVNERMKQVEELLCLEADDNRTLGLWGMGGIGKTTLARAIFDTFSYQFEASEFIENFTEQLTRSQVLNLQDKLFSRLLGDDHNTYRRTHANYTKLDRLRCVKVLIVVDDVGNDVGNIGPLEDLLTRETCDLFGPGSRIILTSRNKQLLQNLCNHVFEVKGLDHLESLQLFYLHAFKKDCSSPPSTSFVEMSWRATDYGGGNPLALRILGSHLYGRDEEFWSRELGGLRNHPNHVVENVLRKSYDGLSQVEKNVFLDIACFYPLWSRNTLGSFEEKVIEGCYEEYGGGRNLVTNLVDKSLISVENSNEYSFISMHKLLQSFGHRMVNGEKRVGKRSRLWEAKDICHLFRQNKGTEAVEGIVWDLSNLIYQVKEIRIMADAFERMENLHMLVICYSRAEAVPIGPKLIIPENGLISLPESLKCLEWESFPSKSLPPNFSAQNLVTLDLVNSDIVQLWNGDAHYVDLGNLKSLNLGGCIYLKKLPNLSTAKKLERLDLAHCQSLLELPLSILHLPNLEEILLWHCISLNLYNFQHHFNNDDEEDMIISTEHLATVLPRLQTLSLSGTRIKKIPDFLCRLQILELGCNECSMMTDFPVIPTLQGLRLGKTLIREFDFDFLHGLKELFFTSNDRLTHLSTEIYTLKRLERLHLSKCTQLKEFPEILEGMEAMVELDLSGCINLSWLPYSISNMVRLERLYLSDTAIENLPSSIGYLPFLSILIVDGCNKLARLPYTICMLYRLAWLDVSNCDQLRRLVWLPCDDLNYLNAYNCKSLETISDVEEHDFARSRWRLGNCPNLDIVVSVRLLYKFIRDVVDPVPRYDLHCPLLILPEETVAWAECMVGGETSTGASVVVELRRPWKLKGAILWALLDPSALVAVNKAMYSLECAWSMIDDDDDDDDDDDEDRHVCYGDHDRNYFSTCLVRREVSRGEQLGGVFLWYDGRSKYKYGGMVEGLARVSFSMCAEEMAGYGKCREVELLDSMIKSCGVKLVYDDDDDDEEDDEYYDDEEDDDEDDENEDDDDDDDEYQGDSLGEEDDA